ncbi:MAG: formate dehydrogenase iron-sulfur subunit, partial [Pirellulaceae bacterium]
SWLSREILAFSLFPAVTSLHAGALVFGGNSFVEISGLVAALVGGIAVFCSAMIYIDTQRPFWNAAFSVPKFFGSCVVLGIPVTMLILLCDTQLSGSATMTGVLQNEMKTLAGWLLIASTAKLAMESVIFLSLRNRAHTPLKRSAMLLRDELGLTSLKRYFFGVVGGVGIPALLYVQATVEQPFSTGFLAAIVTLAVATLLIGELLERYLYFAAVTPPKMPGVQAS